MADDPTPLHRTCASCKNQITKGQFFTEVNTPDGLAPIHRSCIENGSVAPKRVALGILTTAPVGLAVTTPEAMLLQVPLDALGGMATAWSVVNGILESKPAISDDALHELVDAADAIYNEALRLFGERATDVFESHGYEP